jgi:hypothetical protein
MSELNENQSPGDRLTPKWAVLVGLCSLPIFFLFAVLGEPGRGRIAAISAAVAMTVARARWDLRRQTWFWITQAVMIALHAPLVLFIHWPTLRLPGIAFLPVAALDYGVVYGCIRLVERAMKRSGDC